MYPHDRSGFSGYPNLLHGLRKSSAQDSLAQVQGHQVTANGAAPLCQQNSYIQHQQPPGPVNSQQFRTNAAPVGPAAVQAQSMQHHAPAFSGMVAQQYYPSNNGYNPTVLQPSVAHANGHARLFGGMHAQRPAHPVGPSTNYGRNLLQASSSPYSSNKHHAAFAVVPPVQPGGPPAAMPATHQLPAAPATGVSSPANKNHAAFTVAPPVPSGRPSAAVPATQQRPAAPVTGASSSEIDLADFESDDDFVPVHRPALSIAQGNAAAKLSAPASGAGPLQPLQATVTHGPEGKIVLQLPRMGADRWHIVKHLREKYPFLKAMPHCSQHTNMGFHVSHLPDVLKMACPEVGVELKVQTPAPVVMALLKAGSALPDESSRFDGLPESLKKHLLPFQAEGVKFGLRHGGRVLIGDEMGLGKTIQALSLMQAFRDEWPVLIIAPVSLLRNWADEAHMWLGCTEQDVHVVGKCAELQSAVKSRKPKRMTIASYQHVANLAKERGDLVPRAPEGACFRVVVCDESHSIKDHKSNQTKAVLPFLIAAKRVVLLSGTPALAKPAELLPPLQGLLPSAKLTLNAFANHFCEGDRWNQLKGCKNLPDLNMILVNAVMIRRLKKDVLVQLRPKIRKQVMFDLPRDERAMLDEHAAKMNVMSKLKHSQGWSESSKVAESVSTEQRSLIMEYFTMTAEYKQHYVERFVIEKLAASREEFLVFAHHQVLLDACERAANRSGAAYIRIDGNTVKEVRQARVNRFQEDEACQVAVLSIRAAGTGLTLTRACHVVFAELIWDPGQLLQAEDRCHRVGQACTVTCEYLLLRNSVDEKIWEMLQRKMRDTGEMLDGKKGALTVNAHSSLPRGVSAGKRDLYSCGALTQKDAVVAAEPKAPRSKASRLDDKQPTLRNLYNRQQPL